jgi:hypothetical protein
MEQVFIKSQTEALYEVRELAEDCHVARVK